jgi:predicted cobalt transporter CbtA
VASAQEEVCGIGKRKERRYGGGVLAGVGLLLMLVGFSRYKGTSTTIHVVAIVVFLASFFLILRSPVKSLTTTHSLFGLTPLYHARVEASLV